MLGWLLLMWLLMRNLMWRTADELTIGCGTRELTWLHSIDHGLRLRLGLLGLLPTYDVGHIVMLGRPMIGEHARVGTSLSELTCDALWNHGLILRRGLQSHVDLRGTLWMGLWLGRYTAYGLANVGRKHALLHLNGGITHDARVGGETALLLLYEDALLLLLLLIML